MRVYVHDLVVPEDAVDENGHANNVAYVGWMQDAAVAHSGHSGGTGAAHEAGGTWVVRSHRVEYLRPAFEGQALRVRTWVADLRRARSRRRYEFARAGDGTVIARGETEWVFIDAGSGRPRTIPETVRACFEVVDGEPDGD